MKKSVKVLIGLGVVAAIGALVVPRFFKPDEPFDEVSPPAVTTMVPQSADILLYRGLIGTIEPMDMVTVIPKIAGEITELHIKAGDRVTEGQVIAKIDSKQVDSAKISMDSASLSLSDARTNLNRMQVLYQSGDISQQAYEQVVTGVKAAELQYKSAKLNYDTQVEYSTITAPISGLVESCNVEQRDMVSQQNVLCVISGEGGKSISFSVTESIVENMKIGDPITLEKNGHQYSGSLTEISTMVDTQTGLFQVKAAVDEAEALATGSSAKLYVVSEKAIQTMTIPVDAVYYENTKPFVYCYENQKSVKTFIETGIADEDRIQILSGLTPESQVITSWSAEISDQAEVTLADQKQTDNQTQSTEQ